MLKEADDFIEKVRILDINNYKDKINLVKTSSLLYDKLNSKEYEKFLDVNHKNVVYNLYNIRFITSKLILKNDLPGIENIFENIDTNKYSELKDKAGYLEFVKNNSNMNDKNKYLEEIDEYYSYSVDFLKELLIYLNNITYDTDILFKTVDVYINKLEVIIGFEQLP